GAIESEVALKVLNVPDAIASPGRFAAERQALAMLRHPSIAHLYDADVDADGRAYIAMERVPGIPADAWREQVRPDARQSVELILQLADALEPQSGRVRLIDFGLVTAVGASALRRWLNPRESDVGGTPYFMAPEQASIEPVPHDVRVDVYGAGALLYFLLSGRAPIDLEDCRSAPAPVVLEAVRARPRRPVREVAPGVDRDLAAVVDRALLPDDRYPNIAALTGDLRRWRAGRPVQARRAGWANASIKFIRRNKAPVAAITMMLLLLVGGLVGTAIGLRRAQAENQRFRERIALTPTMTRFFTEDRLGAATANRQGRDLRVADLLDRAVERLPGALDDAPLVEASLRYVLGRTFMQLGDIARADTIAAPALALVESHAHPQDPITARVINLIGQIRILQNKPDAAEALFQRTLTTPAGGRWCSTRAVALPTQSRLSMKRFA
ncbi:MAG TPA: serine/threonine-protein kinase, partial [Tepidisphaeraceae bacterium]|nr:serine/threonine-protein kinase [Tepidisphaeraceae bacterium]